MMRNVSFKFKKLFVNLKKSEATEETAAILGKFDFYGEDDIWRYVGILPRKSPSVPY